MALSLSTFLALESTLASAEQQVLGGDEVVLHGVGFGLGPFQNLQQLGRRLRWLGG